MTEHSALTPLATRPPHIAQNRVVDFDVYAPPGGRKDFFGAWKSLQKPGGPDLVWTPHNGGHWIATSGRVVSEVYADYKRFSAKCVIVPQEFGRFYQVLPSTIDPPEHRYYRNLLSGGLTPKIIAAMEDDIRARARTLIEGFRANGKCDFTSEFAEKLPIHIFLNLVDLPHDLAPQFREWVDQVMRPDGSIPYDQIMKRIVDYMAGVAERRRGGPGRDLISHMINGKIADRPLTQNEAAEMSAQVLIGGMDTVVNMLGLTMHHLATHPQTRRELIDNPKLIDRAVEEVLRRYPIAAIAREIIDDMTYEGVEMKQGEMIVMPTMLHGLDERENERPMEFDLHRKVINHSTFGNGIHKCPGAHLARTEIRIALEEWLPRIPDFTLDPDLEITYSSGVVGRIDQVKLVWTPTA